MGRKLKKAKKREVPDLDGVVLTSDGGGREEDLAPGLMQDSRSVAHLPSPVPWVPIAIATRQSLASRASGYSASAQSGLGFRDLGLGTSAESLASRQFRQSMALIAILIAPALSYFISTPSTASPAHPPPLPLTPPP